MSLLYNIKLYVPRPVKEVIWMLWTLFRKPSLKYIELHLTDHCNLNCKGCGHFSSIAPKNYTDFNQYEKDMYRLKQLFPGGIQMIRLMGGEPLLHPDAPMFIVTARAAFPQSDLRFCTNGMLLPQAGPTFWEACRATNTILDLTLYPPIENKLETYCALCKAEGVGLSLAEFTGTFLASLNLAGNSDKKKAFENCQRRFRCPFLQAGRLYHCTRPALIHYFNEKFGHKIIADEGIDIYSHLTTGRKILQRLRQPIITCKWCVYDFVPFMWSVSRLVPEEWEADANRIKTESTMAQ